MLNPSGIDNFQYLPVLDLILIVNNLISISNGSSTEIPVQYKPEDEFNLCSSGAYKTVKSLLAV